MEPRFSRVRFFASAPKVVNVTTQSADGRCTYQIRIPKLVQGAVIFDARFDRRGHLASMTTMFCSRRACLETIDPIFWPGDTVPRFGAVPDNVTLDWRESIDDYGKSPKA